MKKSSVAFLSLSFLLSCSQVERKEVVVSSMFDICMPKLSGAKVTRNIPVDTEQVTYDDRGTTMSLFFSHYPGERSGDDVESQYTIGGPIHIRVLNEDSDAMKAVAVIEFDSVPGGVLPRAYGRISYISKSGESSSSDMRRKLSSWRRCSSS